MIAPTFPVLVGAFAGLRRAAARSRRCAARLIPFAFFASFAVSPLSAVPQIISYQGRVTVGGTNFDGPGLFKFALVDNGATATYWSNDGTSAAGSEPTAAVSIPVTQGSYSVLLGDATLANMTAIPAAVFDNDGVYLRTWFDDGVNGSQQLTPDQRIAPVGYAMIAAGVPDGAVTTGMIANDAVTMAKIAAGAVDSAAIAADNLSAAGGVIVSTNPAEPDLAAAGYVVVGALDENSDLWLWKPSDYLRPGDIPGRYDHTAVWTGTEMIVWGGSNIGPTASGGRYNPATNTWTATTTSGYGLLRDRHTAVWTGTEMIVFGGHSINNTAGRYNPVTDSWILASTAGAPSPRDQHVAVWTGTEMIVWGGDTTPAAGGETDTGGRYNPSTNSWTATTTSSAPAARRRPTAVWTGTEMIVWGGHDGVTAGLDTGGRYSPATDSWTATDTADPDLPSARYLHSAVWTGTEMIVWGGDPVVGFPETDTGGRYNPSTDSWTATANSGTDANTPSSRNDHTAVWTGAAMIVWGGDPAGSFATNTGGRYDPATNSWTLATTTGSPPATQGHTAVWTGTEMIVWGGLMGPVATDPTNSGGRYNPGADSWTLTSLPGAPPNLRVDHTAVWTGTEMIVWGGTPTSSSLSSTGGRYVPSTDDWTTTSLTGVPEQRTLHTAVWTGTEMIVWGGRINPVGPIATSSGGRYNPATDSWTATTTTSAPSGREGHTAVWSGSVMVVWGGGLNTGGRYNPVTNSWAATTTTGAPTARTDHTVVWANGIMHVWGGNDGVTDLNTGGLYAPSTDTWFAMNAAGAPAARTGHTAVWDGNRMIVWGGDDGAATNTGGIWDSVPNSWTATTLTGAPSARSGHTAVWTGSEMIVWGGNDGAETASGAFYDPFANSWTPTPFAGAPGAADEHTAVWTGSEMIIWGDNVATRGRLARVQLYVYQKQ